MPGGFTPDMYNNSHIQNQQDKENDISADTGIEDNGETSDNQQIQNDNDVTMENWDTSKDNYITVTHNRKRFKATINAIHVPGNSFPAKENSLLSVIGSWPGFLDCKRFNDYSNKEVYFTAQFQTADNANAACDRQLFDGNDFKLALLKDRTDEATKRRTLVVRDLPLDVNKHLLSTILENTFGDLESLKLRPAGPWYRADAVFKSGELLQQKYETIWSIQYKKDLCRIAPAAFSQDDVAARNEFVAKLTCLPFGTTAIDLKEVLEQVKGKTCFIPRTNSRYTRKRFAYISFASENDLINVFTHSRILYRETELLWDQEDAKTCHKCGSSQHEIANCPEKRNALEYRDRQRQFTGIYNRYHVHMPPFMKNNKPTPSRSTQPNSKVISQEESLKPMLENLFKSFQAEIDKKFDAVSQQLTSLSNRIKILEVRDGLSDKRDIAQPTNKSQKHKQPTKSNLIYVPTKEDLNKHMESIAASTDNATESVLNKGKQPAKHNLSDSDNNSDPESSLLPKKKVVVLDPPRQEIVKDSDVQLIAKQQKFLENEMTTMKNMIKGFTSQLHQAIAGTAGYGSNPETPNK